MSFTAQTYCVLIASPSDLAQERDVVEEAISDWNALHAQAESTVLLPVRWETHASPQSGIRPQAAINHQLVESSDILVGMFWTRMGTGTGVAQSGTVEEIDQFVAAGKPSMLYFSSRPIDPNKIDLEQLQKLRDFKEVTYEKALTGSFEDLTKLRQVVSRDLMRQVRALKSGRPTTRRSSRLAHMREVAEVLGTLRQNNVTFEEFERSLPLFGPRRKAGISDPVKPGQVGPNGYAVGYTPDGDKVEWVPDDDDPSQVWPLMLRRNDKAILAAYREFWDKVWYNRNRVHLYRIETGQIELTEEQKPVLELTRRGMRKRERKYGKRNLQWDDFEWGLLSGRMSALSWVMGAEWDESLDT